MTVVHAQIMRPDATGTLKPARGYLRWRPVRGWSTAGNSLVLPQAFRVKLAAGNATATVEPNTADWAWEVTFELLGRPHEKRVYSVPASGTTLELAALTEVSVLTGTPAAPLPANWEVVLATAIPAAVAAVVPGLVATAVGPAVEAALGSTVEDSVDAALASALPPAVTSAVSAAVTPAVGTAVASAVSSAVSAAVPGAVSSAVSAALANRPAAVTVVTGSEARPATSGVVSWIGGTVQPVSMVDGDLWFKALP